MLLAEVPHPGVDLGALALRLATVLRALDLATDGPRLAEFREGILEVARVRLPIAARSGEESLQTHVDTDGRLVGGEDRDVGQLAREDGNRRPREGVSWGVDFGLPSICSIVKVGGVSSVARRQRYPRHDSYDRHRPEYRSDLPDRRPRAPGPPAVEPLALAGGGRVGDHLDHRRA